MKGFSLALGGGGARGFAHFGVLLELCEAGFFPTSIAGTSMGAIVGGIYAAGQDLQRVIKILSALDLPDFFGVPDSYRALMERAIAESLVEMVRRRPWWEINAKRTSRFLAFLRLFTKGKRFEELSPPFCAVACDLATGEEIRIQRGPVYLGVGASAALPGLLGPIRWEGRWLIDGGVTNNLPVDVAAEKAKTVVAVDVSAPFSAGTNSLVDVVLRAYEITAHTLTAVRLERMRERLGENLLVLRPELEGVGLLDFQHLPRVVEAGRAAARPLIAELRNRL
ncbi:MAG: patatin-like phospholipase family protein [Candidatus Bipolaricaulota bacterium]|nr:patatin-like phospholipase family protein [Candidatus Bipolaricaulota bacterium]MDW8126604.1 patatin-like phospholipase family protein [Candidatus Bipolaricaulota bacterium]